MTRDQLQHFISRAINEKAERERTADRVAATPFGKEIHISATRDGDPTDRAFYRLTLHARKR
jgi:hypothetical protein